jgi:type II secretory ATPase GspE/PulE/Tfp pilus assembly ATPase PilB-like protein
MRIPDALAIELLRRNGSLSDEQIAELYNEAHKSHRPVQDVILKYKLLSPAKLSKLYAEEVGMPYIKLDASKIRRDHLDHLGPRVSKKYHVVVFDVDEDGVRLVAVEDPGNNELVEMVHKEFDGNVRLHVASPQSIKQVLQNYHSPVNLIDRLPDEINEDPLSDNSSVGAVSVVSQTINSMLEHAVMSGVSDIHIEPTKDLVNIRFRIDGKLKEAAKLPLRYQASVVRELRRHAKLADTETNTAYEGSFKFELNSQGYSVKLTSLPVIDGEKIVLHVVNELASIPSLKQIGFWGVGLKDIEQSLAETQGLILVVGGKSSGKSTTLLSLVSTIKAAGQSIATIEENIKTRLSGVNQTEVGRLNNLSTLSGLEAVLSQDVNVVMVDELRDEASIDLVINAANSGHLMMGSFHSESSTHALTKLDAMGVRPFLSAAAIKLIIAQRLVRRLCDNCREAYRPDAVTLKHLEKAFSISPSGYKHLNEIESIARYDGLGKAKDSMDLSTTTTRIKRLYRAKKDGCSACNHSGYKGRLGLFEVLVLSDSLKKQEASCVSEQA